MGQGRAGVCTHRLVEEMAHCLLNIDLGELPDEPEALYRQAQLANVACGGHAGDRASMRRALERCRRFGVGAGAHPAYPDRAHFGRRELALAPGAVRAAVEEQCAALAAVAAEVGVGLGHVKPHGALYHAADRDPALARAVIEGASAALGSGVAVVGPPGGALESVAAELGMRFLREGFADRGLLPDGHLLPRGQPGAVLEDPAAARLQALRLAASGRFDTLCVHGDGPAAIPIAAAVRAALEAQP